MSFSKRELAVINMALLNFLVNCEEICNEIYLDGECSGLEDDRGRFFGPFPSDNEVQKLSDQVSRVLAATR